MDICRGESTVKDKISNLRTEIAIKSTEIYKDLLKDIDIAFASKEIFFDKDFVRHHVYVLLQQAISYPGPCLPPSLDPTLYIDKLR